MEHQRCWRCKQVLPAESFGWRKDKSKGRRASCLSCEDPEGTKRCRNCEKIKPKDEFHRATNKRGYLHFQSDCKQCQKGFMRRWRLAAHYGMTVEDYDRLLELQGGVCALCGNPPAEDESLSVDHDHSCCPGEKTCGKCVRGLLCALCNRGLGYFKESLSTMERAIDYIKSRGVNA